MRLLAFVIEKKPELRRPTRFKDGDFDKAVAGVHKQAVARAVISFVMVLRVSASAMRMSVAFAAKLLNHMVEAESDQRPARYPRKPTSDFVVQSDAQPRDEKAKDGGEQDVPASGQRRDGQCPRLAPFLHPCRQHEGQPVRRDGGMEEGNGEARHGDGRK